MEDFRNRAVLERVRKARFFNTKQVEKEIRQLETNPYAGKPIGYKFFREKKALNYLVYYLIYEEFVAMFVVALSDKKGQQKAIASIKSLIPFYRDEVMKKLRQ